MHDYKKHYREDGSFDLIEYRTNGKKRTVGIDNSEYIKFIKNNTPEEVAYVAPKPYTREQLILHHKYAITEKYENLIYSDFEFPVNSGIFYAGDRDSMELLKEAVQMFSILGATPEDFQWWDVENVRHSFSLQDFIIMFLFKGNQKETCLTMSRNEKDAVEKMTLEKLLVYEV